MTCQEAELGKFSDEQLIECGRVLQARLNWKQYDELFKRAHGNIPDKAEVDMVIAVLTEAAAAAHLQAIPNAGA